jgi:hypothetical protein
MIRFNLHCCHNGKIPSHRTGIGNQHIVDAEGTDACVNGNVTLYVWNANTYANVNQLTAANANQAITATKANGGVYSAIVKVIAAKTLDETIYVAAVYTNPNGEACCSGVIAYSLSTYCMNTAAGNMGALAQATAMYGYYAAQYFAN